MVADLSNVGEDVADDAVEPRGIARRPRFSVIDGIVCLCVLILLGFAPVARLVGDAQRRTSPDLLDVDSLRQPAREASVRDLPIGLSADLTVRTPHDLAPIALQALGRGGSAAMLRLLDPAAPELAFTIENNESYPFHYPALDAILDAPRTSGWANNATALGAALTLLAVAPADNHGLDHPYRNAGPAAFAVLDRARADGACAAQLDLLLLVAANDEPHDESIVAAEADRASHACPGDPTPRWILGQYLSQRERAWPASYHPNGKNAPPEAAAVFAQLAKEFPASAAVMTGVADSELRTALRLADAAPFTARNEFRAAQRSYQRAVDLGAGRDAAPGLARTLIGLGEPERAAAMLKGPIAASQTPGSLLELLIAAEEADHDFAAAASDARQLARMGHGAYPHGPALYPMLGAHPSSLIPEPRTALSFGADRLAPLTIRFHSRFLGGGSVDDLSFIPTYRPEMWATGTEPSCIDWTWRRDSVLAGHPHDALTDWPSDKEAPTRNRECYSYAYASPDSSDYATFHAVVQLEAGMPVMLSHDATEQVADIRQNMWRWAGNMTKAADVIRAWSAADPTNPTPELRLGEVDHLQKHYDDAAADFARAARRTRTANYRNDLGVDEALLRRAAALLAADRASEASRILRDAESDASLGVAYQTSLGDAGSPGDFATVAYYARVKLADHEREAGQLHAAAEDYAAAEEVLPLTGNPDYIGIRSEALYGNSALADLALHNFDRARTEVNKALAVDAANPAFLMTAAYIAELTGQTDLAVHGNSLALESDPGAYPAANDLGVELARQHHNEAAATALRQAVGARSDYALGWFNLGVLYERMGPTYLLASQGALGKAFALQPDLHDRQRQLSIDSTIYRTGLDLSKPLPPHWSLAEAQRRAPVASVGILAVLLVAVSLARAQGRGSSNDVAEKYLDSAASYLERSPLVNRFRAPAWGLAATVATFLLALAYHPSVGIVTAIALAVGLLIVAGASVRARVIAARTKDLATRQESWGPGIVFGLIMGGIGTPWAPLPVVRSPDDSRRVHLAAPVTLSVLAALLFVESALFKVPLTESLAVATLIMAASTLVPISPLDGAKLGKNSLIVGAGLVAAAIFVTLGLI